jgi:hypothetical protein
MVLQIGHFARRFFDVARKAALAITLTASFANAGATFAQTQIPPPEPHQVTDANGVNLLTGALEITSPEISVGPVGKGGLSYSATFDTTWRVWRPSTAGGVNEQSVHQQPVYPYATVTILGRSMSFAKSNSGQYYSVDDAAASMVVNGTISTVTLGDGSVAVFDGPNTISTGFIYNKHAIGRLTRPNGEIITYNYAGDGSLVSITNNYGYQLHFDYTTRQAGDGKWYEDIKVTALNNAVDACAPTDLAEPDLHPRRAQPRILDGVQRHRRARQRYTPLHRRRWFANRHSQTHEHVRTRRVRRLDLYERSQQGSHPDRGWKDLDLHLRHGAGRLLERCPALSRLGGRPSAPKA